MRSSELVKARKPYKITKPRERWSDDEHEKFLEAIERFGRNWKEIVSFVGTRSVSQVRSHAQKHFIRLEKKGLGSVVPPARRKARWSDKQPADSLDGSTDSDQDLSGMHQQTNSSSSISTFDYHQARASVGSAAQCAAGSGNDCQPITSRDQSIGSFSSRSLSIDSPPSQSIIAYAQEFLRCCNSKEANASAATDQVVQAQARAPKSRGLVLDMLQCIAGAQQGSTSSAKLPSSAAVALQQQQLQQLLCQHQLRQQHHLKQQPFQPSQNGFQAALSPHKPASTVPRPPFGSWPWQQPAAAASSAQPDLPVQFSLQHPAGEPSVQSMLDQQLCPQLDGSYLAECIKSSASLLCTPSQYQSLQVPPQMPPPSKHLSTCHPSANTGFPGEKAEIEPSVSIVSPTTSFQSLPSANSTLTAKHEADLPAELHSADGSFEAIGLDDEDLWAGFGFEDPLMSAVDAAMECHDIRV